ncbi:hypothetical protein OC834_002053 [Tilletia horrida]|uniref:Uncharacterized protein n=1 Tax=Tilletia horrida TaxID=155126 RepID=A0AAN6JKG4_9BASI|nr:hypothetical protein OC835_003518 [Tilletia horrida]KAK0532103.1 hypothetical protein OC842_003397 [Tilletia horrida]KAK0533997.1 hypothetical protein OC834_002053 [Tilletia horrida]KAK0551576.1 hypothetical protein OC844_006555 [Tilletia horrida]
MQLSTLLTASIAAVLASTTTSLAAPASVNVEPRQLGGGPNNAQAGDGWSRQWTNPALVEPKNFDAIPVGGCSYDIVFRRDARDTSYKLAYYSVFGEGEVETQELKTPINLQWRGTVDSTGRREYYGFIKDACSTFYTARPPPRVFKIYFTESTKKYGYISPKFY